MGPVQAIVTCFRKYATFSGRASRSEFWWFGFNYLAGAFVIFWATEWVSKGGNLVSAKALLVYLAIFIIPFLAVTWRRFHDFGRSGVPALFPWVVLIAGFGISMIEAALIPSDLPGLVGALIGYGGFLIVGVILLIWLLHPPTKGPNKYGPNPHEVTP